MNMPARVVVVAAVASLSACSNSGAGRSVPLGGTGSFVNWSSVGQTASIRITGTAETATYTQALNGNQNAKDNNDDGPITLVTVSGPSGATAEIDYSAGSPTRIEVAAGGATATVTTATGTISATNPIVAQSTAIADRTRIRVADPSVEGFEYQTYGTWVTGLNSGSGSAGAGSFGARTTTAATSADGTYSGNALGLAEDSSGGLWETRSTVTVTTTQNFSKATIASSGTTGERLNAPPGPSALSALDFTTPVPADISSNQFTAGITGSGVSGTASGQFYGTTAQEVGGTFSSDTATWNYVGAFGATR